MNSILKPNILAIALMVVGLVGGIALLSDLTIDTNVQYVVGLATLAIGAFASIMFRLTEPAPNPEVDVSFAADLVALAAGTGTPRHEAVEGSPRAPPMLLLILVGVAAVMSLLSFVIPDVPQSVSVGLTNGTVGMIAGLLGKLAEPEPDRTVPQSIVIEALRQISAEKAGK